jgi:hypothetical protein
MLTAVAAAAATATSVSSVVTTTSGITIDFAHMGLVATVLLILVLISKELLSAEPNRFSFFENINAGLDISIASLLPVFSLIVAFKIITVVN